MANDSIFTLFDTAPMWTLPSPYLFR